MSNLSEEELSTVVKLLSKLSPGFLQFDLFLQVARLVTLPIFELVALRQNGDYTEVLLLNRQDSDPIWPGLLHITGTVIRATDKSMTDCFDRIKSQELSNLKVTDPVFVKSSLHQTKRGSEFAQIYWSEVLEESSVGKFYPIDHLPQNIVEGQATIIQEAAASFRQNKQL